MLAQELLFEGDLNVLHQQFKTCKEVIPLEVKAEVDLQAKSLKVYHEKFQPKLSIRTSMADYKKEDWLLNLPLWAVEAGLQVSMYIKVVPAV